MSFARARAVQGLRNGLRQSSSRPAIKSNTFRRAQLEAKRYASSGGAHKSSSDLPWLISALVITPVSCYYLWPSAEGHAHHDSHDKHEEKHEEPADEPAEEEKPAEKEESKEEEEESKDESDDVPAKEEPKKESKKSDDQGKKSGKKDDTDSKEQDESKSSKKGGDSSVDGVNFKGKLKPDSDGAEHDVKVEGDSKGENKKRLDSGLQKNLGPPASKGERDSTQTSDKQAGLSNTQSRHSTPINESNEKSKKADGTPETSKAVGTVH